MMVEKAKNSIHTATKALPNEPNAWLKAAWARAVPVRPPSCRGCSSPELRITRAVMVRTMKVSIKTPIMAARPWSWGLSTRASAWAWGVEPMPASLENRPRATPYRMASLTPRPATPPNTACGSKAQTKMDRMAPGRASRLMNRTISPPTMYRPAMMGTIFSVTEASRLTPPMKMNAAMAAARTPITMRGTPKAL